MPWIRCWWNWQAKLQGSIRKRPPLPEEFASRVSSNKSEKNETPEEIPTRKRLVDAVLTVNPRVFEIDAASEGTALAASSTKQKPTSVLLVINVLVHLFRQMCADDPSLYLFMNPHSGYSHTWKEGMHTILLSGFTHKDIAHLGSNMAALQLVGPKVCKRFGSRVFSYFYITALYA